MKRIRNRYTTISNLKWFTIVAAGVLGLFGMIAGTIRNDDFIFTTGLIWIAISWLSGDIVQAQENIIDTILNDGERTSL